jgi:hypothetical protein
MVVSPQMAIQCKQDVPPSSLAIVVPTHPHSKLTLQGWFKKRRKREAPRRHGGHGERRVKSGEWREKRRGTTKDTKYTKKEVVVWYYGITE